jgi:hypothetical protein
MYNGEPQSVSARDVDGRTLAKPKSASFSIGNEAKPATGISESWLADMMGSAL